MAGLHAVRVLRGQLRAMPVDEGAKYEIEFRLRQKEREFQQALIAASGIRVEALSNDGVVVPGQDVTLSLVVANHGAADVAVRQVKFDGFASDAACTLTQVTGQQGFGGGRGRGGRGDAPPQPPAGADLDPEERRGRALRSASDDSSGCPRHRAVLASRGRSRPVHVRYGRALRAALPADRVLRAGDVWLPGAGGNAAGEEVIHGLPVQYRYQGDIFSGEKRSDMLVVPALSVRVSPEVAIVPAASLRSVPAAPTPTPTPAPAQPHAHRPGGEALRR